jgi:hypothetical protein
MMTIGTTTTNVMGLLPATNAKMPTTTNKVCEETKRELHIVVTTTLLQLLL